MTIELVAFAAAFAQWPSDEVWGTAHDGNRDALVHGRTIDGVMVFDEPVVLEDPAFACVGACQARRVRGAFPGPASPAAS